MCKMKQKFVFFSVLSALFVLPLTAESAQSPRLVCDFPGVKDNPRNGEGDFVRLNDGSVFYAYSKFVGKNNWDHTAATIVGRVSRDGGETWSEAREIIGKEGKLNVMCVSFLRLDAKRIAVFYLRKNSNKDCTLWMRVTDDDFKTLSAPRRAMPEGDIDYYVCNNSRAVRLSSGRIILPLARHSSKLDGKKNRGKGRLSCVYSDDSGETWKRSEEYVVNDASGNRIAVEEPGLIELKDGRLFMYARTALGRQWQMFSKDGGHTWSDFGPSNIIGPCSPATIKRLKNGDLLLVWNDHEGREHLGREGPKWCRGRRAPLDIAISRDEGRTWIKRKAIETNQKGFYCYCSVIELDDSLLVGYYNRPYLTGSCIKKISKKWLYEGEGRVVAKENKADSQNVRKSEDVILPVEKKASLCEWELIPYETIDGMKGKFAHIASTDTAIKRVKIPLGVKGRYRVWIGTVVKRYGGYVIYTKLDKDKYPMRMSADFKADGVPQENPMIGELEFGVVDLEESDSLVIRNASGAPGGVAYVRLESAEGEKTFPSSKNSYMIATNDSYWKYSDKEEYFAQFNQLANSPVGRIHFCALTGENSFTVKTSSGINEKYDPSNPYPSDLHAKISEACERLAEENPNLLKETVDYVHSRGMEIYAYFRPGAAVDFRRFFTAEADAEKRSGKCLYAPENRCRLWDGTIVGRPSYAKEEVRRFVSKLCAEMLSYGFDGINFTFTRALPTMLFEDAFKERFRLRYNEELKDPNDPRVVDLRCELTSEFLAEIKKLLGEKKLSLTVLSSVERNREYGLDIAELAKAGIVDEFIVDGEDFKMPRKISIDKIDFESFRRATAGTKAILRPQFTMWWNGLSTSNFKKSFENGFESPCLWDAAHMPWKDWECIRRIDGSDLTKAEEWEKKYPDSSRVKRLKTVNNYDIIEYPWWLAF